jgi:hypothetical protein
MSRALPRFLAAAALAAAAIGCTSLESLSNPLIGQWTAEAPGGAFSLGTYEFRSGRMMAMGLEQEVDYQVAGDRVRVIPRGFGPQLEATIIDRDTARLGSPVTGGLITLHRVR